MDNNIINAKDIFRKNLDFNKSQCEYHIKKNGKISFIPSLYKNYMCMLKNINMIDLIKFPYLYEKNEKLILRRLLLLHLIQKKNFKYIKINTYDKNKDKTIFLFDESKINNVLEIMFLSYITEKNKDIYNYYYSTILKSLITFYTFTKLIYNKTDNQILISIFYNKYLEMIWPKINKKYKKKPSDFENYHELYIFLKKEGYVDKYYNYYANKMISNSEKFYKKIVHHPELNEYKNKMKKKIKDFNKIDLLEIIDDYISDKFDKNSIKNKYIKLISNIDINI